MKQSKTQLSQVEVSLPDYVTIKQFKDIMSEEDNGTIWYKIFVIATTLGVDESLIRDYPMSILPQLYDDCVGLYIGEPINAEAVKVGDKKLLASMAYKSTIGEFAELEEMIKSGDIIGIASVIFREYDEEKYTKEYVKQDGIEFTTVSFSDNQKALKKYDSDDLLDKSVYEQIPLRIYQGVVGFMLGIGATFSVTTLSSSKPKLATQREVLKAVKSIGDGLVSSATLQKLTYFKSVEKVAS